MSDLRDELRATINEAKGDTSAEAGDVGVGEVHPAEGGTGGDELDSGASPEGGVAGAGEVGADAPQAEGEAARAQRLRDEAGKFKAAPKGKAPEVSVKPTVGKPAAPVKPTAPVAPVAPTMEAVKAPQSWSPAAREHWAKLAPEVQREAVKREREVATALQESAGARKHFDEYRQSMAPYSASLGPDPQTQLRTLTQYAHTAHVINTGNESQVMSLVAGMIKARGFNSERGYEMLAQALDGTAAPQGRQQQPLNEQAIIERAQAAMEAKWNAARTQQSQQQAQSIVAKMAEKEFFSDLRPDIAEIMATRQARGLTPDLEAAYSQALKIHRNDPDSEIGGILRQRDAAKAAPTANAATERTKAAASSVKSQPAPAATGEDVDDIRDVLRTQIRAASRGK